MVSLHFLESVKFDVFAPSCHTALLIGSDIGHLSRFLEVFACFEIFHCAILSLGIRRKVDIKGFHLCGVSRIKFSEHSLCILKLSPLSLYQILGSHDVLIQGIKDALNQTAKVQLDVFQLASHFLVFIEGTLSCSHHNKLIGNLVDRLQLLLLQFSQVTIDSEVPHMLCVFLDFVDEVFVRGGSVCISMAVSALAAHQYLLTQKPEFLNLSLEFCVLGDVCLVH